MGVRAFESERRAQYDEESFGMKQKGQYSHNSILDWSSAEVWLYIYSRGLVVNNAYKKGMSRVGCLFCPMGGSKNDYFSYISYPSETDSFIDIIKTLDKKDAGNPAKLHSYVVNGGWNARKNGRDLTIGSDRYFEEIRKGKVIISIEEPSSDWKEWIKTIGDICFPFEIHEHDKKVTITVDERVLLDSGKQKNFKQVFKKAAHCINCGVCEANCRFGRLTFKDGAKIDACLHCGECHNISSGCLVFHSIRKPYEERKVEGNTDVKKKNKGSINNFANHAPRLAWIIEALENGPSFWVDGDNTLGPNQQDMFMKFLKECHFVNAEKSTVKGQKYANWKPTVLFERLQNNGIEDSLTWGFAFVSISYLQQIRWYITRLHLNTTYKRENVADMLMNEGVSAGDSTSIISAFGRLCGMPFGTALNFGNAEITEKGGKDYVQTLTRTKMHGISPLVILYALYRYAEAEKVYQFTLETLMDFATPREGMSPAQIFSMTRDELEASVRGLSAKYPEYVASTFTHDLDKISLRTEHNADEILSLL